MKTSPQTGYRVGRLALLAFMLGALAFGLFFLSGLNDFSELKCGRDGQCEFLKQQFVFPPRRVHFPASHIHNPPAEVRIERYACGKTNGQHCVNILLVSATGELEITRLVEELEDDGITERESQRLRRAIASGPPWDLVFTREKKSDAIFGALFVVAGLIAGFQAFFREQPSVGPAHTSLGVRILAAWGALWLGAGVGSLLATLIVSFLNLPYPDNLPGAVAGMILGAAAAVALAIHETRPRAG